jgi:hypothetical protein
VGSCVAGAWVFSGWAVVGAGFAASVLTGSGEVLGRAVFAAVFETVAEAVEAALGAPLDLREMMTPEITGSTTSKTTRDVMMTTVRRRRHSTFADLTMGVWTTSF